jgi:rod shape-determining protein MreC
VILEQTRIRGILRGNAQGQPQIVGILSDSRIKPGERVLTAGGDQIFPRGLDVGVVDKVLPDPDRDGFIRVIVKPAAHLDRLDEVLVITDTQPRFSDQELKDMAQSQDLKGGDAAALSEQRKASEIMAERLPGLTDPNAPPPTAQKAQPLVGADGQPVPANPVVVPKIIPPAHSDRFTPGNATTPNTEGGTGQTAPKAKKPAAPKPDADQSNPGENPPARPAAPKPANPQHRREF